MVTLETLQTEERDQVVRLVEQHGARRIRVFGFLARGEARDTSDLDLLVDWEPGRSLLEVGLILDIG